MGVKQTPRPTLKDEVETTRIPQKVPSSQHSSPKEGKWGPQEAGIEAPCLGLAPPPRAQQAVGQHRCQQGTGPPGGERI